MRCTHIARCSYMYAHPLYILYGLQYFTSAAHRHGVCVVGLLPGRQRLPDPLWGYVLAQSDLGVPDQS